ncbi:MAG: DUF554 domain-containing protein [Verrucomicrobiae bacterium]|nr:DUF554 domain-containing protein [Verrucomicrobiae bacterium]
MIGTALNVAAIVAGGLAGSHPRWRLTQPREQQIKTLLGVLALVLGGKLFWEGTQGPFLHALKLWGLVLLSLMLGKMVGRLLGLQQASNRLGQYALQRLQAPGGASRRWDQALLVGAALFCAAPLAFIGSLQDGLHNFWFLLAVKAVMDGLAAQAFVPMLGRGIVLAALPVAAWQGLLTLGTRALVEAGWLSTFAPATSALHLVCGFLAVSVAVVIFEVRKVELANYLPALVVAPGLARWLL